MEAPPTEGFPHNINFLCKSFTDLTSGACASSSSSSSNVSVVAEGKYDAVLCLSVVKWVHLNEGDEGLLAFFHRLFQLVRHGGVVVFEFQPWKSYVNNKGVTEHIKANFNSLRIRPEHFAEILVSQVGFALEANIGTPLEAAKGFDRPIFVLRRPLHCAAAADEQSDAMMCEGDETAVNGNSFGHSTSAAATSNNNQWAAAINDRKRKFEDT